MKIALPIAVSSLLMLVGMDCSHSTHPVVGGEETLLKTQVSIQTYTTTIDSAAALVDRSVGNLSRMLAVIEAQPPTPLAPRPRQGRLILMLPTVGTDTIQ